MSPELPPNQQTTQSLVLPPVRIKDSAYVILHDGTVARLLKPRKKGNITYWSMNLDGRLKVMTQKSIDELAAQG
jgi:hypothetical protein